MRAGIAGEQAPHEPAADEAREAGDERDAQALSLSAGTSRAPTTANADRRSGAGAGWPRAAARSDGHRPGRPSPRSGTERDRRRGARPGATRVSPFETSQVPRIGVGESHWIVPGRSGALSWSRPPSSIWNRAAIVSGSLRGGPVFSPRIPARRRVAGRCGRARSARARSRRSTGPAARRSASPALRSFVSSELGALGADLLEREAEHLGVAPVPAGRRPARRPSTG